MRGIITLEDLSAKGVFIDIKPAFYEYLKRIIKEKATIRQFFKETKVDRIVGHWLDESSLIRLDVLKKISKFLGISDSEIRKNIRTIRGKDGFCIKNPKIPFNFRTKAGVRFIAAIFGDGCLDKKYRIFYANSQETLIKEFLKNSREVLGDVEYDLREKSDNKDVKIVSFPPVCGKIVSLLGLSPGSKVKINPSIPQFIFNLEKDKMAEFISQIIDDEGSINFLSRHLKVDFALEKTHKNSNLLDGIKKLLLSLGIDSVIYQYEKYPSSKGEDRKKWQLEIHSFIQFKKLYRLLNLKHRNKKKKFKKLLDLNRQIHFPKKKCTKIYLSTMRSIEKRKGSFTSRDLSRKLNRNLGHVQNMIHKYYLKNLIYQIREVKSDGLTFYPARYRTK